MTKLASYSKWLVSILALLILTTCLWFIYTAEEKWPEFQASTDLKPQIVSEIEPDFGYRIGDRVPVSIVIKQAPNTKIDLTSFALEGDFESVSEAQVSKTILPDGTVLYRVKLQLQSFETSKRLRSALSLTWDKTGEKKSQEFRAKFLEIYVSRTWDGRDKIKDGLIPFNLGIFPYLNIAFLIASVFTFFWSIWYRRYYLKQKKKYDDYIASSPKMLCRNLVNEAWAKIEAGDRSKQRFQEIAVALRDWQNISTVLLKDIPNVGATHSSLGRNFSHFMRVLIKCERVIYGKNSTETILPELELNEMRQDLNDLFTGKAQSTGDNRTYVLAN